MNLKWQWIIQKQKTGDNTEIVVITDKVREGDFKEAVQRIADHPATRAIRSTIRVYTA